MLRLEVLRRGLAEYGSPSLCCRVRVEASTGGGSRGESEVDGLWDGAVVVRGRLDFLT